MALLGGEGHRGKGQGGNDQRERQGDALRSQGPLWQDQGGREGNPAGQRQRSLDLLGGVLRGSHGDVSGLQRGRGKSPEMPQRGGSRQGNDRGSRGLSVDRQRKDRSRPRGEDRLQHQGQDHLQEKTDAELKKIQPKDQKGPTLEQDLSSLLVQQVMQENEELRKRLDAMSKSQPSPRGQQVQQVQQQDELDTSSWESVPSRTTPTTPTNRQTKDVNKVTPGGTRLPDGPPPVDKVEKDPHAAAIASSAAYAIGRLRGVQ